MEIKKQDFVIIVEGNLDVVSSFSAGVKNTVAVSGTALTPDQINILKRYTKNFKLCFDMDEAGQKAATKSVQLCLAENIDVEIILLPDGFKDVNDLVIKDVPAWKKAIKNSQQVMDYFFSTIISKNDKENPKGKKIIAHKLLNIIKDISDLIEQSYWIRKLSDAIDIKEDTLTEVLERVKIKEDKVYQKKAITQNDEGATAEKPKIIQLQERILGLVVLYQKQLEKKIKSFEIDLLDQEYQELWAKILKGDTKKISTKISQLEAQINYIYSKEGLEESEIDPVFDWEEACQKIKLFRKEDNLASIIKDIKTAEEQDDEESLDFLMEEFSKISKDLEKLKK